MINHDEWQVIDLPGIKLYFINEKGEVYRPDTSRYLTVNTNQGGVRYVSLERIDGTRSNHTVANLVAQAYLEEPDPIRCGDTPTLIFKDGNKDNFHKDNLAWRTRSYAVQYTKYMRNVYAERAQRIPIRTIESGGTVRYFSSIIDCAIHYGVRSFEIVNSLENGDEVYFAPGVIFEYDQ